MATSSLVNLKRMMRRVLGGRVRRLRLDADAARGRTEWENAARLYRQYLARRPGDGRICIQLGHMLREAGDLQGAAAAYARAGDLLGDEDADLLLSQGRLARLQGDEEAAAALLVKSVQRDPTSRAAADLFGDQGAPIFAHWARLHDWRPVGRVEYAAGGAVVGWLTEAGGTVEFRHGGQVIGSAAASVARPDLAQTGLVKGAGGPGGFSFSLSALKAHPETGWSVEAVLAQTGEPLLGSPFDASPSPAVKAWLNRPLTMGPASSGGRVLSLILPVHDPRPDWLAQALASVQAQTSGAWELICVDDASSDPEVKALLTAASVHDARICLTRLETSRGVAGATNVGLAQATGDWVAFMDHDDVLEPEAVARLLEAADLGADLAYSDEVLTHEEIHAFKHFALRPSFSHDYYLSHPYFVHLVAAPLEAVRAVGGLDESLPISADVDLVLRLLERSVAVAHIPSVLYRWRTHSESAGHRSRALVTATTQSAINAHLARLGLSGRASPGATFNTYRIDWPDDGAGVLAIIPTKNRSDLLRQCIASIDRTTPADRVRLLIIDHDSDDVDTRAYLAELAARAIIMPYSGPFNFARMNNEAVRLHARTDERLLFLNNDVEAIAGGWVERLTSLVARPEVGVAGATLLYPDRRIQHAGVALGLGGYAEHVEKFAPFEVRGMRNAGADCGLVVTREFSAVTAACMMMRREVFDAVGGFDETFEVGFNDTDLCLRVAAAGYRILNDGQTVLLHHESATRRASGQVLHPADAARLAARWGEMLTTGDPFYNPLKSVDPAAPGQMRLTVMAPPRLRPGPAASRSGGAIVQSGDARP